MPENSPHNIARVKAELEDEVADNEYVYVGPGSERRLNVGYATVRAAVNELKQQNYVTHYIRAERPDVEDPDVIAIKVLTGREKTYRDVWRNRDKMVKLWRDAQTEN